MVQLRKGDDKRDRIMNAAITAFAQTGYHQATMAAVAREAGVAAGTIYLYFKSKDDLLISIFEEKVQGFIHEFHRQLAQEESAEVKLRKLVQLHLFEMQKRPDLAAVFQLELRQSRHFMSAYPKADLKSYFDLIGEIIEEGQQQGLFRKDLYLSAIKRAFFGAMDEMTRLWVLSPKPPYDIEDTAKQISNMFLLGINAR